MAARKGSFSGSNVFLSRSLVPPEAFDALHDALKLNGAQVFLCCDPSRTAPNDYHVISSLDHEKFEDLKAKCCNLLGPQCVFSCAKEHRALPKQGYTCCLAMDGVKVLASGFEKDEKVKLEQLVMAMGGILLTKVSLDVNFVIVKNVLAAKYKWALNVLKKPIVNMSWLYQCWNEHRLVPQEPHRILPFTGLTICVTKILAGERKEMEKLIMQNGGQYSADLTRKCTHLVSNTPGGDKYVVARRWGHIHIVTRRWFDLSIARRACLDEEFYPVLETSLPCNDKKVCQKEQQNQPQTSQPVVATEIEDLETTMSQNISSSFSDARKANNEETEAPILQTKDEMNFGCHVAEDSETEDNDLYLSNCRILLMGFDEKELHKLVIMIRKGGGSRHMLLSEKLTHIIIGTPTEIKKKEVRRLAAWGVINVVKATWLEDCDRAKKEIPVSIKHIVSELLLSKDSTCSSTEPPGDDYSNRKGKYSNSISQVAIGQNSDDQNFEGDLLSEKQREKDRPENGLLCSSFTELVTKSSISNQFDAAYGTKSRCMLQNGSGFLDKQNRSSLNIFKGQSFCFSRSFPDDRRAEIIEWVKQGGGVMVDDPGKKNADFVIESHGVSRTPADESLFTVVSPHWIRFCLEEGCMQDVGSHVLFTPLCCSIPLSGFEGLRFCISQYEEKDRMLLRNMCHTLGAKFTEKLTKKVTHLLCKFTNGPKYEAAYKWGIQTVTAEWITECIKQDMMVSLDSFRPKPVTAQDREAGLCTVSQHPTQAASMVFGCGSSQLWSEFHGTSNDPKQRIEPVQSNASRKRLSLLGSDSNGDATKKNRIREDSIGCSNAAPDVADAIEDLLAQSNKIQDMKPPETSSCDQSIFPPDHSILGQDHANSHSTFGISRHWLNRSQKQSSVPTLSGHEGNRGTCDTFSETQTDSQVVGYEEDLSGRQKIIDRVRSQSTAATPDK